MMVKEDTLKVFALLLAFSAVLSQNQTPKQFLAECNREMAKQVNEKVIASWEYGTNITSQTEKRYVKGQLKFSQFVSSIRKNASKIDTSKSSEDVKRQFKLMLSGATSHNQTISKISGRIAIKLKEIYNNGCVNATKNDVKTLKINGTKCLQLHPDLVTIMKKSRDPKELLFAWKGYRDSIGPKIKSTYEKYVEYLNIGAKENKWKDYGDYLRSSYEVGDQLEPMAEKLWADLKPLFDELHAYIRFKLSKKYSQVKDGEAIPAHLLGTMHADDWLQIYDLVVPFPNEPTLDETKNLVKDFKNNVTKMYKKVEEFFLSIGWPKLPDSFWTKSLFEKPKNGRKVQCMASAWDFYINKDVRIRMCTQVNQADFTTIHHELGHIYYFLFYWNQPYIYRDGANPGFHEAIGNTISLSVQTPEHLFKIGLLDKLTNNTRNEINFLLKSALLNIAFLPYGYLLDRWRWRVLDGSIKPSQYNSRWWEMRTKYQGVKAPIKRTENDFDPGSKFHVPNNMPYIRYFMAFVYQFHFHKAACKAAGHKGNLNKCSIYNSKAAGKMLSDMLRMGKSKQWQDAFKIVTGSRKLTAQPIKDYFQVLYDWMKEQRKKEGYSIGWQKKSEASAMLVLTTNNIFMLLIAINFLV